MTRPETPLLTVDVVIQLSNHNRHIVLIKRKNPPYGWALPGGFVDLGESVEDAAVREAEEETGLAVKLVALLGCYSNPQRDPRGQTASVVYVGLATGTPQAQSDASQVAIIDPVMNSVHLAFDHDCILADYCQYLEVGKAPQWDMASSREDLC